MQSPGPIRRGKSLHACLEEDVTSEETALYAAFINHVLASDRLHIPSLPIPTDNPQVLTRLVADGPLLPLLLHRLHPKFPPRPNNPPRSAMSYHSFFLNTARAFGMELPSSMGARDISDKADDPSPSSRQIRLLRSLLCFCFNARVHLLVEESASDTSSTKSASPTASPQVAGRSSSSGSLGAGDERSFKLLLMHVRSVLAQDEEEVQTLPANYGDDLRDGTVLQRLAEKVWPDEARNMPARGSSASKRVEAVIAAAEEQVCHFFITVRSVIKGYHLLNYFFIANALTQHLVHGAGSPHRPTSSDSTAMPRSDPASRSPSPTYTPTATLPTATADEPAPGTTMLQTCSSPRSSTKRKGSLSSISSSSFPSSSPERKLLSASMSSATERRRRDSSPLKPCLSSNILRMSPSPNRRGGSMIRNSNGLPQSVDLQYASKYLRRLNAQNERNMEQVASLRDAIAELRSDTLLNAVAEALDERDRMQARINQLKQTLAEERDAHQREIALIKEQNILLSNTILKQEKAINAFAAFTSH